MVIGLRLGDRTIKSKTFQLTKISRKHSTTLSYSPKFATSDQKATPSALSFFFHLFSYVTGPKSVLFVNFRKEDLDLGPWKALFFFRY